MSGIVTVIPIRSFSEGKSRLAGYIPPDAREQLVRAMFRHVLATVNQSGVIGQTVVVSPDPAVLAEATSLDPSVITLVQPLDRSGLNAAVTMGRERAIELQASGSAAVG